MGGFYYVLIPLASLRGRWFPGSWRRFQRLFATNPPLERCEIAPLAMMRKLSSLTSWGGPPGPWGLGGAMARSLEEAEAENATLSDRNATLTRELMALQSGNEAVEKNARENLGLIKEGEVYYQFIEEPDSP